MVVVGQLGVFYHDSLPTSNQHADRAFAAGGWPEPLRIGSWQEREVDIVEESLGARVAARGG